MSRLRTLAAAVLVVMASACGGTSTTPTTDPGDNDAPAGTPQTPSASDNVAADSSAAESEGPRRGGSVSFMIEAETSGGYCLPEATLATSGIQVARSVYDTLVAPNADGDLVPMLAESMVSNEDFTQWTITLRDGIVFHDGTELDATVLKNNLDAYRGAYPGRTPLLGRFTFAPLQQVDVIDDRTVEVTLSTPWSTFDWTMWGGYRVGIMGQAQLDDPSDCGRNLVGTGPFALEDPGDWVIGEQIELVKNADYWRTDASGTSLPYLDAITFQVVAESTQRSNALLADQADVIHTNQALQIAEVLQPAADRGEVTMVANDTHGAVNYALLNHRPDSPFSNRNARQAFAWALDEELFNVVRAAGIRTVANGPFAPTSVGYVDDTGHPGTDLDTARQFADAYHSETGEALSFTFTTLSTEDGLLAAQEMQSQMLEAGIDMTIDATADQATLINIALSGDFDAIDWRMHPGGEPDLEYNFWHSASPVNFGAFHNDEVDRLLDEARAATPGPERDARYEDLNRVFGAEAAHGWNLYTIWAIAATPSVHGFDSAPLPDGSASFVSLDIGTPVEAIWLAD